MNKRLIIFATLGCIIKSTLTFGSGQPDPVTDFLEKEQMSKVGSLMFSSAKEMVETSYTAVNNPGECFFYKRLKGHVLYAEPLYGNPTASDVELANYNFLVARHNIMKSMAEGLKGDIELKKTYLMKAIEPLLYYKKRFFPMNSNFSDDVFSFTYRKLSISSMIKEYCKEIFCINMSNRHLKTFQISCMELSVSSCDEVLNFSEWMLRSDLCDKEFKKYLQDCKTNVQMDKLVALVNLASSDSKNAEIHLKKANVIKNIIYSSQNKDLIEKCKGLLNLARLDHERSKRHKKPVRSQKRKEYQKKARKKNKIDFLEKTRRMEQEGRLFKPPVHVQIDRCYHELGLGCDPKKEGWQKGYLLRLKELEGMASELTEEEDENANIVNVQTVYTALSKNISGDTFFRVFPFFATSALTLEGDIEGAIERLEVIMELYRQKFGNISHNLRVLSAYLNNLNGNPEEWLSIENEIEERKKKAAQKKKAAKTQKLKKQSEARVRAIKKEREINEKRQASLVQKPLNNKKGKEEDTGSESGFIEYGYGSSPLKSTAKLKAEKRERHHLAEQERKAAALKAQEEDKAQPSPASEKKKPMKLDEVERLCDSTKATLSKLYDLTGLPAKVDASIEEGLWEFTRQDLKAYFEAMGCIYKPGKGSHKKLKLPKCMHVYQGSTLLSILTTDLGGGALTLPSWEKNYVPKYLRAQILSARKLLKAMKIKANKESTNNKN